MAETSVPSVDGDMQSAVDRQRQGQGVEIAGALTAKYNLLVAKILDGKKTKWVKFNRNMVITGEFADRHKVFNQRRRNVNIMQMEGGGDGGKNGGTSALDWHGCSIADDDA